MVLAYLFFFQKSAPTDTLTTTTAAGVAPVASTSSGQAPAIGSNFLSILLNVKNIKLDDSIFSDPAFLSLHDSSILLISDGTEGRPNPFAPIGSDTSSSTSAGAAVSANALNAVPSPSTTNTTTPPSTTPPATTQTGPSTTGTTPTP